VYARRKKKEVLQLSLYLRRKSFFPSLSHSYGDSPAVPARTETKRMMKVHKSGDALPPPSDFTGMVNNIEFLT